MDAPVPATVPKNPPPQVTASPREIAANRRENLRMFESLREHMVEIITQLRENRLEVERLFHNPKAGVIIKGAQAPSPADLVSIATAARIIADGTYRALGDGAGEETGEAGKRSLSSPTTITVLLPGVVSEPRQRESLAELSETKVAQVVDLRPSN